MTTHDTTRRGQGADTNSAPATAADDASQNGIHNDGLSRALKAAEESPLAVLGAVMLMYVLGMGLTGTGGLSESDVIAMQQMAAQQAAMETAGASAPGPAAY